VSTDTVLDRGAAPVRLTDSAELPLGLRRLLSDKDHLLNRANFEFGVRLSSQLQHIVRPLPACPDL
jgi:hypothetical protein